MPCVWGIPAKLNLIHPIMKMKLYARLASLIESAARCDETGNYEWATKHRQTLRDMEDYLPSGSGFDAGTTLDEGASSPDKLIFETSFHHMDEHGGYDGWTEHRVIVTPSLAHGYNLRVTGRDRNGIKSYIVETFAHVLDTEV
jgi:hypothetical protein